jgi:hypothetical protein
MALGAKTGGRIKGTPNRKTADIQELLRVKARNGVNTPLRDSLSQNQDKSVCITLIK